MDGGVTSKITDGIANKATSRVTNGIIHRDADEVANKVVGRAADRVADKTADGAISRATIGIVSRVDIRVRTIEIWIDITIILTNLLVYMLKLEK